jgi:hypothetical protein
MQAFVTRAGNDAGHDVTQRARTRFFRLLPLVYREGITTLMVLPYGPFRSRVLEVRGGALAAGTCKHCTGAVDR